MRSAKSQHSQQGNSSIMFRLIVIVSQLRLLHTFHCVSLYDLFFHILSFFLQFSFLQIPNFTDFFLALW